MASDFVYFILAEGAGRVKIGQANNVKKRFEFLETSSPFPLRLLCQFPSTLMSEGVIHFVLREYRVHREWFVASDIIMRLAQAFATDQGQTGAAWVELYLSLQLESMKSFDPNRDRIADIQINAKKSMKKRLADKESPWIEEIEEIIFVKGWTQLELARTLEMSQASVCRWLTGGVPNAAARTILRRLADQARKEWAIRVASPKNGKLIITDGTIETVIHNKDGSGHLVLSGEDFDQPSLHFDIAPHDVAALNGKKVWGGELSLMCDAVRIAKMDGDTKIVFCVESLSKAIAEAEMIQREREDKL